jgi:lysophospholipase L1-like esterase
MLSWLFYILILVAIVLIAFLVYNIICYFGIKSFDKKIKENKVDSAVKESSHFNLWLWIIKKSKIKSKVSAKKKIERKSSIIRKVLCILSANVVKDIVIVLILATVVYQLDLILTSVSSTITNLFTNKNCICYAICTGDTEDDAKTAYELLFGFDEYTKLCESLKLNSEDEEKLQDMQANAASGKDKSEFILSHLTDDAVTCYKNIVGSNNGFRSGDHKNRAQMTDAELKDDLKALLSDYKTNGRNPNCPSCKNASSERFSYKCLGEKHYVEGWTWEEIWDTNNNSGNTGTAPSGWTPGNATGPYAIQLDDGSYYWYHQSSAGDGCTYCGDWSESYMGSTGIKLGSQGCAIYSLAIGISNLVGKAITPTIVMADLDSPLSNGTYQLSTKYFPTSNLISRPNAVQQLASKYGLDYEAINSTVQDIDNVLSKGGYVWCQWIDAKCDWCINSTNGKHFMIIRKMVGDEYYCFTSCAGKIARSGGKDGAIETMNHGITKSDVVAAMNGQAFALYNNNIDPGTDGPVYLAIIGDSISSYAGEIPSNYQAYYPDNPDGESLTSYDQTYEKIVATTWGATIVGNLSSSGSYVHDSGSNVPGSGQQRKDDFAALTDSPTYTIVFMGTNDYWDGISISEFKAAYETMMKNLNEAQPTTQFICLGLYQIGPCSKAPYSYNNVIKTVADSYGATFINLDTAIDKDDGTTFDYSTMTFEDVHPNVEGMKWIAKQITDRVVVSTPPDDDDDDEALKYLVALEGESSSYEGSAAVIKVVLNRSRIKGKSVKEIVTEPHQFEGYDSSKIGVYTDSSGQEKPIYRAAKDVLSGKYNPFKEDNGAGADDYYYFFGVLNNSSDIWADTDAGRVYNWGNNVFYITYNTVHNKGTTSNADNRIWDTSAKKWNLQSGESKVY